MTVDIARNMEQTAPPLSPMHRLQPLSQPHCDGHGQDMDQVGQQSNTVTEKTSTENQGQAPPNGGLRAWL